MNWPDSWWQHETLERASATQAHMANTCEMESHMAAKPFYTGKYQNPSSPSSSVH